MPTSVADLVGAGGFAFTTLLRLFRQGAGLIGVAGEFGRYREFGSRARGKPAPDRAWLTLAVIDEATRTCVRSSGLYGIFSDSCRARGKSPSVHTYKVQSETSVSGNGAEALSKAATTYAFDPEIAAAIPMLPDIGDADLVMRRQLTTEMFNQVGEVDTAGVAIEDRTVPGADGDRDVAIRVYRPTGDCVPAAIYDVHGGGFFVGGVNMNHRDNVMLARELGVVVVSVDYCLAPENPYPAPLEDVYAGLVWTAAHCDEMGVDRRRIVIQGASAGAGLCAGLALLARDRGGPHIAFQCLRVPELDDRLATRSMTLFIDTPLWNRREAARSWELYLGPGRPGSADVPIYAAPARATDLRGLPPAYISVMEFDPLRDEGIAYAQALLASGVGVELHLFPGTFHGSVMVEYAAISQRENQEWLAVLRRVVAV